MGSLTQGKDKIEIEYRFRYFEDDKVFDSKDRKSYWSGTVTADKQNAVLYMREMIKQLAPGPWDEILMGPGGQEAFIKELMSKEWANAQQHTLQ